MSGLVLVCVPVADVETAELPVRAMAADRAVPVRAALDAPTEPPLAMLLEVVVPDPAERETDSRAATAPRDTVLAAVDAVVRAVDTSSGQPSQGDHGPHTGHASSALGEIDTSAQFQNSSAAVVPSQSPNVSLKKPLPPSPPHEDHLSPKSKFS